MKKFWIVVGILTIAVEIITAIHFNLFIQDIRRTTSQMTMRDVRQLLNIIQRQQEHSEYFTNNYGNVSVTGQINDNAIEIYLRNINTREMAKVYGNNISDLKLEVK